MHWPHLFLIQQLTCLGRLVQQPKRWLSDISSAKYISVIMALSYNTLDACDKNSLKGQKKKHTGTSFVSDPVKENILQKSMQHQHANIHLVTSFIKQLRSTSIREVNFSCIIMTGSNDISRSSTLSTRHTTMLAASLNVSTDRKLFMMQ